MPDVTAFLVAKQAAGLSPRTVGWYEMFVGQYYEWSTARQLPIKKPETVEAFLASLRKREVSAFTVSGCYRALSVFFKWMVQRRGLQHNPMDVVQPPRTPNQRKRHVTPAQFHKLYKSIHGDVWSDYRDRAILLILMYSGLRANELLALTLDDIDHSRGILRVNNGKGGDDRDVPFAPEVTEQLTHYFDVRPDTTSQRVFVAAGKHPHTVQGPLSYDGLSQIIRRRCKSCGLPRLGIHAFRHGYAMLFLNEGEMEIDVVSATMGHSSTDVTKKFYADYATNALRSRYHDALGRINKGQP